MTSAVLHQSVPAELASKHERHHVLYLIDALQSTGAGAEGVVQRLAKFLPSDRFKVSVATFTAADDIREQFPCPVHVFPLDRLYGWSAFKQGWRLRRFLSEEQVDIVHTFFPASDIWGGTVATLSRCPILISSRRDMGILRRNKHRIPYLFVNRWCTQIQAVSERVRTECMTREHLAAEKIVTVPNGVDLARIDAVPMADRRAAFQVESATPVVMTVANPRFVKGIDILVRAAAMVRRTVPDVRFICIGEPHDQRYMEELSRLIRNLGLGRSFEFLGPRSDVFSLLKRAELFCLPSRSEGLSNALLEAMACRLPCVATDVGGNAEVIAEGESGYLVPSEQPVPLAERIVTLLQNSALRDQMGRAGREIVERKFTVQAMVKRLVFLYDDLLQRHDGARAVPERQESLSTCAKI